MAIFSTWKIQLPKMDPFTGCDGEPWSMALLEIQLEMSIENEEYEFAAKCRDEIKRRDDLR
jgi:hypothetical protein